MRQTTRPAAEITADLRALGLRQGDLVMVHASLRRVGPVEGGADGLIEAILDTVAPGGTMVMVLGAPDDHASGARRGCPRGGLQAAPRNGRERSPRGPLRRQRCLDARVP